MARFDVYRRADGKGLILDCQAAVLTDLRSRFVAPLLRKAEASKPLARLNPVFSVDGEDYVMVTQSAAAIDVREIGTKLTSLSEHDAEIGNALDFLLTGV